MSQNYQQYGGNPYGQAEAGYGGQAGQSNPYGGGSYGQSNPYGGGSAPPAQLQHEDSNYSQPSQYSAVPPTGNAPPSAPLQHGAKPLTQQDFLARIDGTKQRIGQLTSDIQAISTIHQRMLSSPDNSSSAELESIVTQTQIRNTQIKDEIKFLERDVSREPNNAFKKGQVEALKRSFKSQLDDFNNEESTYSKRYREAIGRQYRIVNPQATEAEVQEAQNANWGEEGIFTQALKSNRSGQASSVLGAVRARHNDIQRIEQTMSELALLFTQLNEQVVYQEEAVTKIDEQATRVHEDTTAGNKELGEGIKSARRAKKLKWWLLFVVVLILAIIALVLGIWFGVVVPGRRPK